MGFIKSAPSANLKNALPLIGAVGIFKQVDNEKNDAECYHSSARKRKDMAEINPTFKTRLHVDHEHTY